MTVTSQTTATIGFGTAFNDGSTAGTVYEGTYMRLGDVDSVNDESSIAGYDSRGLLINTAGYYLSSFSSEAYEEYVNSVNTTVSDENYDYTNQNGAVTIVASAGDVTITADKDITITSNQSTPDNDTVTSIAYQAVPNSSGAGDRDIIVKMGTYAKASGWFRKKTTNGDKWKSVIGIRVKVYMALVFGAYATTKFSTKFDQFKGTVEAFGVTGVSGAIGIYGESLKPVGTHAYSFIDQKYVSLDEEFCAAKQEVRVARIKNAGVFGALGWILKSEITTLGKADFDGAKAKFGAAHIEA